MLGNNLISMHSQRFLLESRCQAYCEDSSAPISLVKISESQDQDQEIQEENQIV